MRKSKKVEPDYELMFDDQGAYVADFSDAFDMDEFENLGIDPDTPTRCQARFGRQGHDASCTLCCRNATLA